jgi:hypothetical protein
MPFNHGRDLQNDDNGGFPFELLIDDDDDDIVIPELIIQEALD